MAQVRCNLVVYDNQGAPDPDGQVTIQALAMPGPGALETDLLIVECDVNGNLLDPVDGEIGVNLFEGAVYRYHVGVEAIAPGACWTQFSPNSNPFAIPPSVGRSYP